MMIEFIGPSIQAAACHEDVRRQNLNRTQLNRRIDIANVRQLNSNDQRGVVLIISNIADVVAAIGADELNYEAIASGAAFGSFSDTDYALDGGNAHTFTLDTSAIGMQSGEISISSNSPIDDGLATLFFDFEVVAAASGDFDDDGDVDGNDFLAWQRGTTSAADLDIWEQGYGTQSLWSVPVPEPTSLLLACSVLGIAGMSYRGRR